MFKLKRDLSSLKQKVGGLLTPEEVVQKTNELTKPTKETKETKIVAESAIPYAVKKTKVKKAATKKTTVPTNTKSIRRKYTTMLDPRLSEKLKITALQRGISAADLLEQLILDFFKE